MQEMFVKYNLYLAHDFQINKKNGRSAKAIVGQNRQKMAFWGAELQSSKKIRKSTQEPNCISLRKEMALKNLIF